MWTSIGFWAIHLMLLYLVIELALSVATTSVIEEDSNDE